MARQLSGFREDDLADVDIARQESGFAVGEIVLPQPPEPVVEAKRNQVRPRFAEIISPGRERLGIILSKDVLANDRHTKGLAELLQHLRRGQHAAGENVALDEIHVAPVGREKLVLDRDGLDAGEAARQQAVTQLREISWPKL